ncbi:unnamed protein product [Closterium sp. NIES-53]
MAKGIHLEADSTTQEFKLYHRKGGLYIGKAVLKNNVFVLDFVPDLGTADSDGIVTFTSWTHPPDLDPDFSPEGFCRDNFGAEKTTSAAAERTSAAAETSSAVAGTTTVAATTTPVLIDDAPPTPAQQLKPAQREVHRSANLTASFYSNSDAYRRSLGHRASEDIWHTRMGHPSNTVLNNTIRTGVLDKDSLLLLDGRELQRARGTCLTCPEADLPHRPFTSHHNPSAPAYAPLEKVYSDILYNREPGQVLYNYTITFIDAATRYVWYLNLPSRDMVLEAFTAWLPVAERESGVKLKSFQSDGGGEYTSQRFKQYLAERGIKQLLSLPYAHQQQGVAERMNRTLQNSMRKLLRGMRLPNHQWPEAMDHAVILHNLLSSSSLPNNASPHLQWTGKQGSIKMLRVFGCMVQYRPLAARAGRFSQRAQWGLHLGIEKNYNAWKILDIHSKETVAARDVIFYERLTLQTYLANLQEDQDPTGGFRGDRAFASTADEADWDEQNVANASEEAGPLPFCSVDVPMDEDNPHESPNAETFYYFADNGYITPATVNTNEAERVGPNFIPDPETGDEAAYPEDATLPRYSQTGLQILGLVTAVHGNNLPKEPATVQQALGGEHREKWREAMDSELKALEERNTWKVVPISVARNKTILTGKRVFRIKTKADGTIEKFKARWVVRGFDQEHGRDFTETFAPYLGLNIREEEGAIYINAAKYADTIAKRFALTPTTISTPYRYATGKHKERSSLLKSVGIRDYQRKLGCLLFAAVTCRPDLSYSASQLATYLKKPEAEHLAELDRALHYFVSTSTIGLTYYKNTTTPTKLIGYLYQQHCCRQHHHQTALGCSPHPCCHCCALLLPPPRHGSGSWHCAPPLHARSPPCHPAAPCLLHAHHPLHPPGPAPPHPPPPPPLSPPPRPPRPPPSRPHRLPRHDPPRHDPPLPPQTPREPSPAAASPHSHPSPHPTAAATHSCLSPSPSPSPSPPPCLAPPRPRQPASPHTPSPPPRPTSSSSSPLHLRPHPPHCPAPPWPAPLEAGCHAPPPARLTTRLSPHPPPPPPLCFPRCPFCLLPLPFHALLHPCLASVTPHPVRRTLTRPHSADLPSPPLCLPHPPSARHPHSLHPHLPRYRPPSHPCPSPPPAPSCDHSPAGPLSPPPLPPGAPRESLKPPADGLPCEGALLLVVADARGGCEERDEVAPREVARAAAAAEGAMAMAGEAAWVGLGARRTCSYSSNSCTLTSGATGGEGGGGWGGRGGEGRRGRVCRDTERMRE